MSRRAAKTDDNQQEIVDVFRRIGCSVAITSGLGDGFPDLVVARRGKNLLVECKDGSKPPSKRKLTPDQIEFHATWRGIIVIVESIDGALAAAAEYL
jgi:Holliday junction resolvase